MSDEDKFGDRTGELNADTDPECSCDEEPGTCCDGDRVNNMWVEGGDPSKGTGICLLDSMTPDQVVYTLQHNPNAAKDLLRVTSDPTLREFALTVELLDKRVETDAEQSEINRHDEAGSIPFYAIFRGQPPFSQ